MPFLSPNQQRRSTENAPTPVENINGNWKLELELTDDDEEQV